MSNKRITDLIELTTPTTDDVFPVVDIATNTTTKVQLGNLPIPTSVTTALATKENTITPGTTAQYYRGDKSFQTLDKTAVGLGNVDNTSDANKPVSTATQTALNAKQDTLVSGTNIKTINSTSLLGSGNITIAANPSGVSGAIQFSNGSAFASDAANLFWDDTNNRLGVGTNAPVATLQVVGNAFVQYGGGSTDGGLQVGTNGGGFIVTSANRTDVSLKTNAIMTTRGTGITFRSTSGEPNGAILGVIGSGSTSATTSLLVQNSSGTATLTARDDGKLLIRDYITGVGENAYLRLNNSNGFEGGYNEGSGGSFQAGGSSLNLNIGSTKILQGYSGGISIGKGAVNPVASAQLEVVSTTKGFLPPVMTTTQKNAIATPAAGLMVYDTTLAKLCVYTTTWETITSL